MEEVLMYEPVCNSCVEPVESDRLHAEAQRAAHACLIAPPLEMLTGLV